MISQLEELSEKYPQRGDVIYMLGTCYALLGEFEKSCESYKKSLELRSFTILQKTRIYHNYLNSLIELDKFQEANELFNSLPKKIKDHKLLFEYQDRFSN